MSESHRLVSEPSPLLALVALSIVHRYRPKWCAVSLSEVSKTEDVRLERLSRITKSVISTFEVIVAKKTAIGRPPKESEVLANASQLALTQTLLDTQTCVLKAISPEFKKKARDIIVGAWLRIRSVHPEITQESFSAALSIPERTLRSWLQKPRATPSATSSPKPAISFSPRKRANRRPRFRFNVMLPDLQFAADTTDLSAFGKKLKLVATQDVGGRDQDLFDSVIIDDHESSEIIEAVFMKTLSDLPGAQLLSDQGTPYMAQKTREALASLEVEHAPQKEGDPTGKSTIERAFQSIKKIARPILLLTDSIANAIPALRDPTLATASASLLITALLRAYQAGARATRRAARETGNLTEESLSKAAENARQNARSLDRSARLFLEHVHKLYDMPRSEKRFIDSFRLYPIEVLKEAERRFRAEIPRRSIKDHASYFAAIVRNCYDTYKARRAKELHSHEKNDRLVRDATSAQKARADLEADPISGLKKALELIAFQWQPKTQILLGQGAGLGATFLRRAIARLIELHGHLSASDIVSSVLRDFSATRLLDLGDQGVAVIWRFVESALPPVPAHQNEAGFSTSIALATLSIAGKTTHLQRSDPLPT